MDFIVAAGVTSEVCVFACQPAGDTFTDTREMEHVGGGNRPVPHKSFSIRGYTFQTNTNMIPLSCVLVN